MASLKEKFLGCLIGTGVGDALGAPYEGYPSHALNLVADESTDYKTIPGYPRGQYTDDTQMTMALVRAILRAGEVDGENIAQEYASLWKTGEIVGPGMSCTDAMLRFIRGQAGWRDAGTEEGRAGNGTAMRASPIGLWNYDRPDRIKDDATVSSIITHKDPRSIAGAVVVSIAVAHNVSNQDVDADRLLDHLAASVEDIHAGFSRCLLQLKEWLEQTQVEAIAEIVRAGDPDFHGGWGGGVTPYVIPTVLAALYSFLRTPTDFLRSVVSVINFGGDVDSTGAITGAICGAYTGIQAIPARLVQGLKDHGTIEHLAIEFHDLKVRSTAHRGAPEA